MRFFFVFSFALVFAWFLFCIFQNCRSFSPKIISIHISWTHRIGWQPASQSASALNMNSSKACLFYFAFHVNALEFALKHTIRALSLLAQANDTQQLQQWEFIEDINPLYIAMRRVHCTHNEHWACFRKLVLWMLQHNTPTKLCSSLSLHSISYWAMSSALETCNLYRRKEFQQNRTNAKHFE